MIFSELKLTVCADDEGVYFESSMGDLEKDTLVVPADINGVIHTVEFSKRSVTFHPANGPSSTISAQQFLDFVKT